MASLSLRHNKIAVPTAQRAGGTAGMLEATAAATRSQRCRSATAVPRGAVWVLLTSQLHILNSASGTEILMDIWAFPSSPTLVTTDLVPTVNINWFTARLWNYRYPDRSVLDSFQSPSNLDGVVYSPCLVFHTKQLMCNRTGGLVGSFRVLSWSVNNHAPF